MSNSGGMLDAYLIAQALGWEWNLTTMIVLTIAPILIILFILFVIFVIIPIVLDLLD